MSHYACLYTLGPAPIDVTAMSGYIYMFDEKPVLRL